MSMITFTVDKITLKTTTGEYVGINWVEAMTRFALAQDEDTKKSSITFTGKDNNDSATFIFDETGFNFSSSFGKTRQVAKPKLTTGDTRFTQATKKAVCKAFQQLAEDKNLGQVTINHGESVFLTIQRLHEGLLQVTIVELSAPENPIG